MTSAWTQCCSKASFNGVYNADGHLIISDGLKDEVAEFWPNLYDHNGNALNGIQQIHELIIPGKDEEERQNYIGMITDTYPWVCQICIGQQVSVISKEYTAGEKVAYNHTQAQAYIREIDGYMCTKCAGTGVEPIPIYELFSNFEQKRHLKDV